MAERINVDEVARELEAIMAQQRYTEGFSRREVEEALGINERNAGLRLRIWVRSGLIHHAGFRKEPSIDGRLMRVPVYLRTEEKKDGPGKRD